MNTQVFFTKLGKRLKTARKNADFTQSELAEQIGITRQYLNQIENGKGKNVSLNIILAYLYTCKTASAQFFTDLQKYVNDYEYDQIISQIDLPKTHQIRSKVLRDIGLYHASIKTARGKAKPLSKQVIEKAVIKFGNYRSKIEHIQSVGYKEIAKSGISTIQNPFYRAYINQLGKIIKQNFLNQESDIFWLDKSNPCYQHIINQWLKKGLREDLLIQIIDAILKYFEPPKQ